MSGECQSRQSKGWASFKILTSSTDARVFFGPLRRMGLTRGSADSWGLSSSATATTNVTAFQFVAFAIKTRACGMDGYFDSWLDACPLLWS
jgi:hypothetical protein